MSNNSFAGVINNFFNNILSFFKKTIFGHYSLFITFWIIYVLGTAVLSLLAFALNTSSIFLLFLLFLFILFSNIGIWNSSGLYIQDKKKQKKTFFLGVLARLSVVLIFIFTIKGLFFNFSGIRMKGLSIFESLILGGVKGITQDLLNFIYYIIIFPISLF